MRGAVPTSWLEKDESTSARGRGDHRQTRTFVLMLIAGAVHSVIGQRERARGLEHERDGAFADPLRSERHLARLLELLVRDAVGRVPSFVRGATGLELVRPPSIVAI